MTLCNYDIYRLKVLQEYCLAVMEIETLKDALSTDRYENDPSLSLSERKGGSSGSKNQSQHGITDDPKVTKAHESSSDENEPQNSDDDGIQSGDDEDGELEENDDDYQSDLDAVDSNGEANYSSESDEDEDGGFSFATEGSLDDPMENALDTLLNIELEINRNAKKPRKK